jgi:hypothetical protein
VTRQVASVAVVRAQPLGSCAPNVVPAGACTDTVSLVAAPGPRLLTTTRRLAAPPGRTEPEAGGVTVALSLKAPVPVPASAPVAVAWSAPAARMMPAGTQVAGGVTVGATVTSTETSLPVSALRPTPVQPIEVAPTRQVPFGTLAPVTVNPVGRPVVGMVTDRFASSCVEIRVSLPVPLVPGTTVAGANVVVSRASSGARSVMAGSAESAGPAQLVSLSRLTQPPASGTAGSADTPTTSGRVSAVAGSPTAMSTVQRSEVVAATGAQVPAVEPVSGPNVVLAGGTTTNAACLASDGPWL